MDISGVLPVKAVEVMCNGAGAPHPIDLFFKQ